MDNFQYGENNFTLELSRGNFQQGSNCLADLPVKKNVLNVPKDAARGPPFLLHRSISGFYFNALFNRSDLLHGRVIYVIKVRR